MNTKNTIPFDPGYAPLVINSIGQVGYTYYMFNAVSNIQIKRRNFPLVAIKIEKLLKINIAFYLGCLLWASCISRLDDYEIEGNKLLGEEASQDEYTSEINFLIDFIKNQFLRDYKYYKGKPYVPDEKYLPILEAYREFLILNNGFINCSKTNQIVLPSCLKKINSQDAENINLKIQSAIEDKNLEQLFDCYNIIF
ncbi:hypothetical protein IJ531_03440 [bacterium]|nr:hypothetical protein [bacterium]